MKLVEALSLRADLQKRVSQLKMRLKDSSKIQHNFKNKKNWNEVQGWLYY